MNVHLVLDEKPTRQDQKLKTLSKYIQKYPQGWKKRLELADLLYGMGNWEQAIAEYRQVIERSPQLMNVQLQLGKILQMMKREAEAIELYGSALTLSCNQGTQHHINGLIAVCKGESQKAIIAFDSAADLEPDKIVHWLALGQVHKGRENPIGALRAFSRVLSLNPDDIVALIHSYDMLMAVGNFQEARQRLSKAIALAPDDFQVLQRQLDQRCGMRLVCGEEGKQTKKLIGFLLRQAPHADEAYKSLAYYHLYRGDWTQGVGVLAEFAEQHPNHPSGWYYYGQCLFHTGEYQAATEMILKAYGLYPNDCEIYRALCEILPVEPHPLPDEERGVRKKGNKANLAAIVKEMLERFPERWSAWATAGRVLVETFKDMELGCSVSFQGTQLQPQLPDAWFRHGRVLALALKHQEAVEALQQGWQLLPAVEGYLQSAPAAVWLGESYQVLGDDAASRKWWKEAITFGSFHSDAHAASPLPVSVNIDANKTFDQIVNGIRFDRKYTVLVANKTGKTLQRVGAYNDSSNWPLGDIDPHTAAGQQFDGIPITNSFSFASNYRVEPGKNVQLAATFPTIGRRKIGLGGINQDGSAPAKQIWDNTNDANDKAVNNPPVEGRASIQQKDGSIIWYYEVK